MGGVEGPAKATRRGGSLRRDHLRKTFVLLVSGWAQ